MQDIQFFATNPSSFVDRFEQPLPVLLVGDRPAGSSTCSRAVDTFGASADLFVSDASGDYSGFNEATLTTSAFEGSWDLFLQPDGETVAGSASASATLAATGEVIRTKDGSPPSFARFMTQEFTVDGSLDITTPAGSQTLPMDGDHCFAAHAAEVCIHSVRPAGPKPGPLANDGPAGAIAAKLGKTSRVVTGANAEAPEEPCTVTDEETQETFEVPFGYHGLVDVHGHRRPR